MVDIVLEGHRSITKAEWYDEGLKEAKLSNKGCLPLVAFYNLYVIKCSNNVQLSIDLGVTQSVQCFSDQGQGVLILNGNVVQATVVLADVYSSAQFYGEEDKGYVLGVGFLD